MSDGRPKDTALKLAYEQAVRERDRLRDARAFFARQLGPLPAFVGVAIAVVAALSDKVEGPLMWIAFGGLALLIAVSFRYSQMPPYRKLREQSEISWRNDLEHRFEAEARRAKSKAVEVEDMLSPEEWYIAQLRLERGLYGPLQEHLKRERCGLFMAQVGFLVVIGLLLAASL